MAAVSRSAVRPVTAARGRCSLANGHRSMQRSAPPPSRGHDPLDSSVLVAHHQNEYQYDFGDSWDHDVAMRAVVDLPDKFERRLLDGARAFPHEDCGGLPGYEDCCKIATGAAEDTEGLLKWLDGWHPERFDLGEIRARFDKPLKKSTARTR